MELPSREEEGRREYDGSATDRLEAEMVRSAVEASKRGKVWRLWTVWTARRVWKCVTDRRKRERRGQQILLGCVLVIAAHHLGVPVREMIGLVIALLVPGGGVGG